MKKFSIVAILAILAATFTGCGNSAPKPSLKTRLTHWPMPWVCFSRRA